MNGILFFGYEWPGLLLFLCGPVGLLTLFWSALEKRTKRRAAGFLSGALLSALFLLSARPVHFGELVFDARLSSLPVDALHSQSLDRARKEERPALYYFHADWCTHCHELEDRLKRQFILDLLEPFLLISVDVTEEAAFQKANVLFGLNQVPALAFANRRGQRLPVLLEGAHFPESALIDVLRSLRE
ncbi:MAG: thioredoxin family protein [Leptospiraceae bacterium]|nr:thioredoxin family protein [Leptospiraceae bacterium]